MTFSDFLSILSILVSICAAIFAKRAITISKKNTGNKFCVGTMANIGRDGIHCEDN